jgi:hypothetical protein
MVEWGESTGEVGWTKEAGGEERQFNWWLDKGNLHCALVPEYYINYIPAALRGAESKAIEYWE